MICEVLSRWKRRCSRRAIDTAVLKKETSQRVTLALPRLGPARLSVKLISSIYHYRYRDADNRNAEYRGGMERNDAAQSSLRRQNGVLA